MRVATVLLGLALPLVAQGDEFQQPRLGPQWFWVREDPRRWSLTARPGFLRLQATKGDIAGTLYYDARNLLLQGTRSGDFVLETRVQISPRYDYQQGGLLVYENDDNYVKLVRGHILKDGGNVVELLREVGGKMTSQTLRVQATDVYLRLTRKGNTFTGEYSFTGKPRQWFLLGRVSMTFTAPKVGLYAVTGPLPNVPEIAVDFDYFRASGAGVYASAPRLATPPKIGVRVLLDIEAEAGLLYQMAASLGTKPGIPLGRRTIPLNPDPLFLLSVTNQLRPFAPRFWGYLGPKGGARLWLDLPNDTNLVGATFYLAFVTYDARAPFGVASISQAAKVTIQQ